MKQSAKIPLPLLAVLLAVIMVQPIFPQDRELNYGEIEFADIANMTAKSRAEVENNELYELELRILGKQLPEPTKEEEPALRKKIDSLRVIVKNARNATSFPQEIKDIDDLFITFEDVNIEREVINRDKNMRDNKRKALLDSLKGIETNISNALTEKFDTFNKKVKTEKRDYIKILGVYVHEFKKIDNDFYFQLERWRCKVLAEYKLNTDISYFGGTRGLFSSSFIVEIIIDDKKFMDEADRGEYDVEGEIESFGSISAFAYGDRIRFYTLTIKAKSVQKSSERIAAKKAADEAAAKKTAEEKVVAKKAAEEKAVAAKKTAEVKKEAATAKKEAAVAKEDAKPKPVQTPKLKAELDTDESYKEAAKFDSPKSDAPSWVGWARILSFSLAAVSTGAAIYKQLEVQKNVDAQENLKRNPPQSWEQETDFVRQYSEKTDFIRDNENHRNIFGAAAAVFAVGGVITFFF